MRKKNANELIESKLKEMGLDKTPRRHRYVCEQSGMEFYTYQPAVVNPYTGEDDFEELEDEDEYDVYGEEQGFMAMTPMPASQADPFTQVPPMSNPAPDMTQAGLPPTTQLYPNPSVDVGNVMGKTDADDDGYLDGSWAPPQPGNVPPYKKMSPGQKT